MAQRQDVEKMISSLKNIAVSENVPVETINKISEQVSELLTSDASVNVLKQNPKEYHHLEVVLPLYVRIIFHPNPDVADRCFIHRHSILEIFQSKLPGIKREPWYKNFEVKSLNDLVGSLESRVAAGDESWVPIWIFVANIVVNSSVHTPPLNKLLSITEYAFKKGKENIAVLESAWVCWVAIINAFERCPDVVTPNRIMKLLLTPLRVCSTVTTLRISTWVHLIQVMGPRSSPDSLKSFVEPFCTAMYGPPDKAMSPHMPNKCAEALIQILSLKQVVENCLPNLISIFGACVNSKPSGDLIELFASALLKAINGMSDDGKSFKLWKALIEQYNNCSESPILSRASQVIFSEVNFLRWVDSGTVGSNDISDLMSSCEFRNKVLPQSVKALNFEDQDTTPTKKKPKKGSCQVVWSNYCEAFISWWSNQSPPAKFENTNTAQAVKDSSDYLAVQYLLLQPIQHHNMWNQAVSKTWARLCEACHTQKLLHTFVKAILDALDEPNFQVQKAIYVAECLFRIDNSFCKQSAKLLETISSAIKTMEFQTLLDVLNLLEPAVLHAETASVICSICIFANERSCDYDQLNTHKIRTKVGKIMRKLENTSSAEKEKPTKAQRTPFRTQSNFLQRLAKAEEKNRTKSPFLTSIFSSAEKAMNCIENGDGQFEDRVLDESADNGVSRDDDMKKPLEGSEDVPIITLPSVLKSTPVKENDVNEGIVAEKENVIVPSVTASPQVSSPRLKITNAREVKTIDSSSPSISKKAKPIAGQKSTPKKVTPSKVSYFDDDANDCIMVPPKPKTTPLTEHQMEVMSKRRTDIPALYQDLSQDTQTSQPPAVIGEVTTGVSPRPIQDSQDIVPGTPSPIDRGAAVTPDRQKNAGKSTSSAKKLDFNGLSTPPSKVTPLSSSFQKMSPVPEQFNSGGEHINMNGTDLMNSAGNKDAKPGFDGLAGWNEQIESKQVADKTDTRPVSGEKSRKKRKSEPTKFSPKLTRSKKSLKSATPDAKASITLPGSEFKSSLLQSPGPKVKSPNEHATKEPNPARNLMLPKSHELTDVGSQVVNDLQTGNPSSPSGKKHEPEEEKPIHEDKSKYSGPQENEGQSSQRDNEILPSSQSTPNSSDPVSLGKTKRSRKRKADESGVEDSKKTPEDESLSSKRSNPSKKKKPFKLGAGGNLESWLVKTDRVPTPVAETEAKIVGTEKELGDAVIPESECSEEALPKDSVDLNNLEEIVPSTQELGANQKPVQSVLKLDTEGQCSDVLIKVNLDVPCPDPILDQNHSPPKGEDSVLDRLAHESPNDDIDLIISPSKRRRRASSVFRGEGDTYLLKDEFHSSTPDEEPKSPIRAKNKSASPTSRKKLHPAGGRSAKMLRLATGTTTPEEEAGIVTPIRRRESIAPVKYGENWPKGHMENWVAHNPGSPCASPFRSVLKKTPGNEENVTPKRNHDSLASPLLSSAKRKRVVFLDPPVTRGLIYEVGSPSGSLHHADVPQGSPYPTWKGDDPIADISPSKRDAERLSSLDQKTTASVPKEHSQEAISPTRNHDEKSKPDVEAPLDVSDEVRRLLDPSEPTTVAPRPEPDMSQFQQKYHLSADFMTALSELDAHIRSLLIQCFECANMAETVDAWKFGDCRKICQMPHPFLNLVKNSTGETLTEILSSAVFPAPTNEVPPALLESSAQTDQLKVISTQTNTPESKSARSQTVTVSTNSIDTNTEATSTISTSTQADLTLPSVEDLTPLLKKVGAKEALLFFSDSMRILSSLSREN